MSPRGDKIKPKQLFNAEWQKRIRHLDSLLAAKGFDPYSRAGIIGNALQESGINPDSVNRYGYSGVWQNSKEIRKAIEDQYGDYSLLSQLRYLDDWTSGSTWVKKGKHRDHTALYSGSFKKTGYKSAQEASEAFQKLYERAVIKDKNGNVIGYQDWDKRNNYANLVYEWLYGTTQAPLESELVLQMRAKEWKPQPVLKPVVLLKQDYPIQVEAPLTLNAYNMPESPSYSTRLPDIQLFMNAVMSDQYTPQYTPILTTNRVLPALNVILPDGNKIVRFKNGKMPGYKDGKGDTLYTVKKGDWLSKIARNMTTGMGTYNYLASYNDIQDPDRIEVGQIIRIPKSIRKGASSGTIEDTMLAVPERQAVATQSNWERRNHAWNNRSSQQSVMLPDVVVTGNKKKKEGPKWEPLEWQEPQSFVPREIQPNYILPTIRYRRNINIDPPIGQLVEHPNNTYINRIPNSRYTVEELNLPGWVGSKYLDMLDTIKENSDDLGGLVLTAWNGVMKHFVDDPKIKTERRKLNIPLKQVVRQKPKEVLDEDFAKASRVDGDTLLWDKVPIDRTGNKYYILSSYPITDDMRFGSRNRGEYVDLDSNNAPLTTYRPIYKYEDYIKGLKYGKNFYKAVDKDGENHQNHFMGYDKTGKFKIGPLSNFGPGDTMTQVFYKDIIGVPRDKNGNLIYGKDPKNPSRFLPLVDVYGENVYDANGVVQQGRKGRSNITTMTERRSLSGKYGNISGGRVLLKVGNETRIVEGTIEHVILEIELMQKNHKRKPIRYYELDNGSYNRGLRTRNGKNITALDLRDYDKQNTASAGGGHFMYILNPRK